MNKLITGLLFLNAFLQTGCLNIKAKQMAKTEVTTLSEIQIDNYKLTLTKTQAWVGLPNFKYELRRKNLFGRYNKIDYWQDVALPDTITCNISMTCKTGKTINVDKCQRTIIK